MNKNALLVQYNSIRPKPKKNQLINLPIELLSLISIFLTKAEVFALLKTHSLLIPLKESSMLWQVIANREFREDESYFNLTLAKTKNLQNYIQTKQKIHGLLDTIIGFLSNNILNMKLDPELLIKNNIESIQQFVNLVQIEPNHQNKKHLIEKMNNIIGLSQINNRLIVIQNMGLVYLSGLSELTLTIQDCLNGLHQPNQIITKVNIMNCKLNNLPDNFGEGLPDLYTLELVNLDLESLSTNFCQQFKQLTHLNLRSNRLKSLPDNFGLNWPKLELLFLDHNQLSVLNPNLRTRLPKLRIMTTEGNKNKLN